MVLGSRDNPSPPECISLGFSICKLSPALAISRTQVPLSLWGSIPSSPRCGAGDASSGEERDGLARPRSAVRASAHGRRYVPRSVGHPRPCCAFHCIGPAFIVPASECSDATAAIERCAIACTAYHLVGAQRCDMGISDQASADRLARASRANAFVAARRCGPHRRAVRQRR